MPHAGETHGEQVCCAGVTDRREWRRLFPVRFRQLNDDSKFKRWQWVEYKWKRPKTDKRNESRRIEEDSISPLHTLPKSKRASFLEPIVLESIDEAVNRGQTLALVRPRSSSFVFKKKHDSKIAQEKRKYEEMARQLSFLDDELAAFNPCPYEFRFRWRCTAAKHNNTCDDWETTAMFFNQRRKYGEAKALKKMDDVFNNEYPDRGMVFALGTHSRYPTTWLLVGVVRLDEFSQQSLL